MPRIAIIGAGPIGLEAALYARRLGLSVTLYEAGRIGEYLQQWGHVRLFSPFGMNVTSLGLSTLLSENSKRDFPEDKDCITGKEHLACYLEPLAQSEFLRDCLETGTRVLQIGRVGLLKHEAIGTPERACRSFRLLLEDNKGERIEEADIVLDCSGTYGQHRRLGDGGIPALGERSLENRIDYHLEDLLGEKRTHYAGKNVLVVGSGYSAATTVCHLAKLAEDHQDTWVIWASRSSRSQPILRIPNDSLRERDRLGMKANLLATRNDANVEFHPQTIIEKLESAGPGQGFQVNVRCSGRSQIWEVEHIIANVGYSPNNALYQELQVHECYASQGPIKLASHLLKQNNADCLAQTGSGPDLMRNPEPGFFILGAKSYGRNSHFLLRIGFEQIRDVFQLITGNPHLDQYSSK